MPSLSVSWLLNIWTCDCNRALGSTGQLCQCKVMGLVLVWGFVVAVLLFGCLFGFLLLLLCFVFFEVFFRGQGINIPACLDFVK